jgi:hypothetical protein
MIVYKAKIFKLRRAPDENVSLNADYHELGSTEFEWIVLLGKTPVYVRWNRIGKDAEYRI